MSLNLFADTSSPLKFKQQMQQQDELSRGLAQKNKEKDSDIQKLMKVLKSTQEEADSYSQLISKGFSPHARAEAGRPMPLRGKASS